MYFFSIFKHSSVGAIMIDVHYRSGIAVNSEQRLNKDLFQIQQTCVPETLKQVLPAARRTIPERNSTLQKGKNWKW